MLEGGKSSYSREVGSVCLLLIGSGSQTHLLLVVTFPSQMGTLSRLSPPPQRAPRAGLGSPIFSQAWSEINLILA